MNKEFEKIMEELAAAKENEMRAKIDAFRNKTRMGNKPFANRLAKNKYLYFIACGDNVKIGVSSDPNARLETLATGAPGPLYLIAAIPNAGHREAEFHKRFAHLRTHGEWFVYNDEIHEAIKELS